MYEMWQRPSADLNRLLGYKNIRDVSKSRERDMSLEYWRDIDYSIEAYFYSKMPLRENKTLLYSKS